MGLNNQKNISPGDTLNLSSIKRPDGWACVLYWRLYTAWVMASERERPRALARMTDHIAVCGCRMGLGGGWSPLDEEHTKQEAGDEYTDR